MGNRLAGQSSPYLLSHAENPVDWYPWGNEALEKAEKEDKPIFLSIGYSACHWCHVMERESFEDSETAEILNRYFVSIKVDREERPDLDSVYMDAVQAATGNGGWPLSVFLLPDTTPFYGGTYFPPEETARLYRTQSFQTVLLRVADAFKNNRGDLVSSGRSIVERLIMHRELPDGPAEVERNTLDIAFEGISNSFDRIHGGFGGAPKFPQPMVLEFLLRYGSSGGEALNMAVTTLEKMALGGIRDHLGGGFHRYSTDVQWLVPHFEKMLYDNALLARIYTEAYQLSGNTLFKQTAEETLDYLLREMRHPEGGFYSSQDADSATVPGGDKKEGLYYTWSKREISDALGRQSEEFCKLYNTVERGRFEGRNILHLSGTGEISPEMHRLRKHLLELRKERPEPSRDEKIITSWNGMAIRALAASSFPLGRMDYLDAAVHGVKFILDNLRSTDGRLLRSWNNGPGPVPGFLQDYAVFARALLEVYRATGSPGMLIEARRVAGEMISIFRDADTGAFHQTGADHERLFINPSDPYDNATPSGRSAAAEVLLLLWTVTGENRFIEYSRSVLRSHSELICRAPSGSGRMLCSLLFFLADVKRVTLSGPIGSREHHAFLEVLNGSFLPYAVLTSPGDSTGMQASVCGTGYCLPPVTDPQDLAEQIKGPGIQPGPG